MQTTDGLTATSIRERAVVVDEGNAGGTGHDPVARWNLATDIALRQLVT